MILEIGDGREIKLPDECSDEFARALKLMILRLEERARDAEATTARRDADVSALRQQLDNVLATPKETGVVEAVNAMRAEMQQGFARLFAAQMAETRFVLDEVGQEVGTKKVMR